MPDRFQYADIFSVHVHAWRLDASDRQHVVSLDLRRQRRGRAWATASTCLFYLLCGVAAATGPCDAGAVLARPDAWAPAAPSPASWAPTWSSSRIRASSRWFRSSFSSRPWRFRLCSCCSTGSSSRSSAASAPSAIRMCLAGGVAWFAHIGGFVAGIILVYLLGTRERFRHRRDLQW